MTYLVPYYIYISLYYYTMWVIDGRHFTVGPVVKDITMITAHYLIMLFHMLGFISKNPIVLMAFWQMF